MSFCIQPSLPGQAPFVPEQGKGKTDHRYHRRRGKIAFASLFYGRERLMVIGYRERRRRLCDTQSWKCDGPCVCVRVFACVRACVCVPLVGETTIKITEKEEKTFFFFSDLSDKKPAASPLYIN